MAAFSTVSPALNQALTSGSSVGSIVTPPLDAADDEELSGPEDPEEEAQEIKPKSVLRD